MTTTRAAAPRGEKVLVVLVVPSDVVLCFLPPRTPEWQPAGPPWPLAREAVASRSSGRIDRLGAIVRERVGDLAGHPDLVQPRIGFRRATSLEP